ncbi:hepatic and glial cell adhesion molecule-like isoform X1 [Heterodontus francisci]|uniref:hepatic and glial cell adhesion molecule-like isoform X1 n=1 Tax=Heterodontus francisci TaxID=7792 RepID=UPI00355BC9D1
MNRDWKSDRNMHRNKDQHSLNIINTRIILLVFHLFTVCGAVTLVTPNTATEVTVGEQVLFCVNQQGQYDVTFCSTPPPAIIAVWAINNSMGPKTIHPLYEGRLQWNMSGSVVLYNAQINDSGIYEIEISYYSTELKSSDTERFELRVFEPVSQPALKIVGDCLTPNIILSCSVSKGTNVTFHWRKESSGAIDGAYNRTDLVIDRGNEQEQHVYRCIAENPIFGSFVPSLFSS